MNDQSDSSERIAADILIAMLGRSNLQPTLHTVVTDAEEIAKAYRVIHQAVQEAYLDRAGR